MTAMTCKLSGLFSIGEDFDDEDLLGTDWAVRSASGPVDVAAAVSSCALRASSVAHREPEKNCLEQTGARSAALCNGTPSRSSTHTAAGQTVALGLRQLSSSASSSSPPRPPTANNCPRSLASQQSHANAEGPPKPCVAQDDFDDWDVDLADLEECDRQMEQAPPPTAPAHAVDPASSAKTLRPPTCGGIQTRSDRSLGELSTARQASGSSSCSLPPRTFSTPLRSPNPRPSFMSAPPQSPSVFPGFTATTSTPRPISRTLNRPQQPGRPWGTPGPSPQGRGLFETISSAPSSSSSSPSVSSSALRSNPLHTPVLTNRLVQLVSASNKFPKKRPRSEPLRPRTRRFPGPAGLLPEQLQGRSLDEIVVSAPLTPAHGVMARLPSQGSSSQTEEDDFSGGAWAAMKAEMGLDERNPSCFLHSYSVVMVLRKAALKQLAKNKVPNMAVLLKSIIHTNTDAKVVFKDPTGEIQGTVHRRLLEDRVEELKVGAVLLLKQVGVFSPSHRNHYLNVTPNNLLRIYAPDGVSLSSARLPPLVLEPLLPSPAQSPSVLREPVSQMHLVFDEEDDEGKCTEGGEDPRAPIDTKASTSRGPQEPAGKPALQDPGWDSDDDLDELLGELPEDTYSL